MSVLRNEIYSLLEEVTEYDGLSKNPETELIESNLLDSMAFILFLTRLDDELGIEIQPTKAKLSDWKTPRSIADYIEAITR